MGSQALPDATTFLAAVAANIAIYLMLCVGLWRFRRAGMLSADDPPAVFRRLERVLTRLYPDAKSDTLREMLDRAKKTFPQLNWAAVMGELDEYEAYKYGGKSIPNSAGETLKLAAILREKKQ